MFKGIHYGNEENDTSGDRVKILWRGNIWAETRTVNNVLTIWRVFWIEKKALNYTKINNDDDDDDANPVY